MSPSGLREEKNAGEREHTSVYKAQLRVLYCDTSLHRTFSQILEVDGFYFPYILYYVDQKCGFGFFETQ